MDFEKPHIRIIPTKTDQLLDRIAWAGLIFLWIYTFINYSRLPNTIPIHYNWNGEIDGYGSKATLLILPVIITIIIIGLTILNRYPHLFNYPQSITKENAAKEYSLATRFIRYIKLIVVYLFIFIEVEIVCDSGGNKPRFGQWNIPLIFALMMVPTIIYLYKSLKNKKRR
ncbi:MAG TPA: DUF1648 domain-containing protein [Ferruginibacter sp.]|nr:DUF1648 domain-containing protein [Ferruginibacter sp.]